MLKYIFDFIGRYQYVNCKSYNFPKICYSKYLAHNSFASCRSNTVLSFKVFYSNLNELLRENKPTFLIL